MSRQMMTKHYIHLINLRNLIVHTIDDVVLDRQIIETTQTIMKTFLAAEVAQLQQNHTYHYVKRDEYQAELVDMSGHSVNEIQFDSMQTTPLWNIFNYHPDALNEHIRAR